MKWKSIEKDGYPKEEGDYLLLHYDLYHYAVPGFLYNGKIILKWNAPSNYPALLPIEFTHYVKIPELPY